MNGAGQTPGGGPLAGIRVLEFSEGWSGGAWAGRLLADLGADVVKVEAAGGDPLRQAPGSERFAVVHTGKRIRRLPNGDGIPTWLAEALDASDVVIDGYPDQPAPAWRDAVEKAAERRPDLILAQVSVYGRTGPLAGLPGCELTAQALAGTIDSTGYPDGLPARVGVPVGEQGAGLFAATGILAALYEREDSGRGQTIEVAAVDVLTGYLGTFLPAYFHSGERPNRVGNRHTTLSPWNVYPTADGWLVVCSGSDAQWRQITDLIGRPELAADPRLVAGADRVRHADIVDEAIAEWTRRHPTAEVAAALDAKGIPNGPILTVGQLLADDHFRAREMVRETPDDALVAGRLFKVQPATPLPAHPLDPAAPGSEDLGWAPRPPRPRGRAADRPPLWGVRVLELASYTAGPYCGRILAALGAEVLKVEPPSGDGVRRFGYQVDGDGYFFHLNNAGTHSVTLDTRAPEGRDALLDLARRSDAFFENFAAGTLAKQGLGPDDLAAATPSLVYASVNGFGLTGPLRDRRAYDTVIQGLAGIMHVTGQTDRPPVKAGISVADVIGATGASAAILAALFHRRRTGDGGLVDVSMHDLAGWLTAEYWPLAATPDGGDYRPGNGHPYQVPHNVYEAADGYLAVAVTRAEEWNALRQVVPDLPSDPALNQTAERLARRAEIDRTLGQWIAGRPRDEAAHALLTAGVPAAPVLNPAETAESEPAKARAMVLTVTQPSGSRVRQLGLPVRFSRSTAGVRAGAPPLGNATSRVLTDLLDRRTQLAGAIPPAAHRPE